MSIQPSCWRPAATLLLLAPFFGECLSTATPPLDLVMPWTLPVMVALYGCGALLCREITVRAGLGKPGLCLLGCVYAVWEEGLVDRFWFDRPFAQQSGVGDYGRVWDISLPLAWDLTLFHVTVSILASIMVVERLFPMNRQQTWLGIPGLAVTGTLFLLVLPLLWESFPVPPASRLIAVVGLMAALVVAAITLPSRLPIPLQRRQRRAAGFIAFICATAHFVLLYATPGNGLPWPVGLLLSALPVFTGAALLGGRSDLFTVLSGVIAFYAVLDIGVGLGGRLDLAVWGMAILGGLWWLHRRQPSALPKPPFMG